MILALSGSLRKQSANTALTRAAAAAASGAMTLAPRLDALPYFCEDVERSGLPASVAALRAQAFQASAFFFATPEYNGNTSGALKNVRCAAAPLPPCAPRAAPVCRTLSLTRNHPSLAAAQALDWLSRSGAEGASPLKGKPFAVVSAGGGGGGAGGAASVAAVCERFGMARVGAPGGVAVRLFDGTARFDSASGDLTDAQVRAAVAALAAELQGAAARHAAAAAAAAKLK